MTTESVTTSRAGRNSNSATVADATAAQASTPNPANDGTLLAVTAANPTVSTTPPITTALPISDTARRTAEPMETPSLRLRVSAESTCTVSSTARPRQTLNTITVAGSSDRPVITSSAAITTNGKMLGSMLTMPARGERKATARMQPITSTSTTRLEPRSRTSCRMLRAETTDMPASRNRQPGRSCSRRAREASTRS